jgi:hypothetical protein
MAGKILCPNEKCKAKIGNYDWAGVQCGCKDWVVPVSPATEEVTNLREADILLRLHRDFASRETRWMKFGRMRRAR